MTDHRRLRQLARDQLALVGRQQLDDLGYSATQIHRFVKSGDLERLSELVFRIGGAPRTARQLALAAVFDAGGNAAASHRTAAALWRLPGFKLTPVHVTRLSRQNRRSTNLGLVHEPKLLLPQHLAAMGPLRLTTPSRTLFDVAAVIHPLKLARAVDDALAKRLTNVRALHEMLAHLAQRGRTGIRSMRTVLAERPPGYRPPESHLEARVQKILRDAGFRGFERQVDVGDVEGWIGRVDFMHRPTDSILQADGDRWHSALVDRLADRTQIERLSRAGFTVARVTEAQVWVRPREVVDVVRALIRAAKVG